MSENWMFCDGKGQHAIASAPVVSRRNFVRGATGAALAAWLGRSALYDAVLAAPGSDKPHDILVTLFLRGGADGLSLAPPHGDDDYYRLRPTLALARPEDTKVGAGNRALDLNGFFGLHPALSGLYPLYQDGSMAVLHAIGSGDTTRSHFEAMATMEYGMQNESASSGGGWVARHLNHDAPADASPLRAVAFASTLPDILRGAVSASAVATLDDFRLNTVGSTSEAKITAGLAALYRQGDDPITRAGRQTLNVLDTLKQVDPAHYQPQNDAKYPASDLGNGLRQVACLIRANVGLEVACLDRGGWDTHVAQGTTNGWFALQLQDVGDSLAAFTRDLGRDGMSRVSVVVMTEFGRRAQENSGLGTDHGRASAMLLLGGGINGGKVYAQWPGLAAARLEDGLDLKVTTDYRLPLSEVIARRLGGASRVPFVFPDNTAPFLGVAKPA